MRVLRVLALLFVALAPLSAQRAVDAYLLPTGEALVGVYYYPWFAGPPYQHVGWTPEFQYDNIGNAAHTRAVLSSMTDYGINHAAFSYWDNANSMRLFERALEANAALRANGRHLYLSPYLEPPTLDERFGEREAIDQNVAFVRQYLAKFAADPGFARFGGQPLTNIYVTYYQPTNDPAAFRTWLRERHDTLAALNAAWGTELGSWDAVDPERIAADTAAHVDLQTWHAERLARGWDATRAELRQATGLATQFTGDNSRTLTGLRSYIGAVGGITWYSYRRAIDEPFARPKACSDIARETRGTFFYTISPGYVDRQQRWPGARFERDPYLYPFNWCQAMATRPDGILILTHSEWFEGSIIDVTREYGKREYETTELYSQAFRAGFVDGWDRKNVREPIAVIYNEHAPFRLQRGGSQDDIWGLVTLADSFDHAFDVLAETDVSADRLRDVELVLLPSCGVGLAPEKNQALYEWVAADAGRTLLVTASPWWRERVSGDGPVVDRRLPGGGRIVYTAGELGREIWSASQTAWRDATVPGALLAQWRERLAIPPAPCASDRADIRASAFSFAGQTLLIPAVNRVPWGWLVSADGPGREFSEEDLRPWTREPTRFAVRVGAETPISEVMALDSDSGRFQALPFERDGDWLRWSLPMHFHALFAIPQTPLKLTWPTDAALTAGARETVPVMLQNPTDAAIEGRLSLEAGPGLSAVETSFAVPAGGRVEVPLALMSAADFATGNRTLTLIVQHGATRARFWRPLTVNPPAILGLRTTRVGGPAGATIDTDVVLSNVGQAPATNVRVTLDGDTVTLPGVAPGSDATARMRVRVPQAERVSFQPTSAGWQAPDRSDGVRLLSGSDGNWRATDEGVVPDLASDSRFLYFDVDDARMPPGPARRARIEAEFLDAQTGHLTLHYDAGQRGTPTPTHYREGGGATATGTGRPRTATFYVDGATFAGGQNNGADFRLGTDLPVLRVDVTLLPPESVVAENRKLEVVYDSAGAERHQTLTLTAAAVVPPPGEGVLLTVANPHPALSVPGVPLSADIRGTPLEGAADVAVEDADGRSVTAWLDGDRLRLVARLDGAVTAFRAIALDRRRAPTTVVDLGHADVGLPAVSTGALGLVWDADRGGSLVGLRDEAADIEHAAHPDGAIGFRWVDAGGAEHDLTRVPAEVALAPGDGPERVLTATAETDTFRVDDRWQVVSGASFATFTRRVTARRDVAMKDFMPVVMAVGKRRLPRIYPLGVGNVPKGESELRGWLETWVVQPGYIAMEGSPRRSGAAVGLLIDDPAGVRRVRYGYFGDNLEIRLRGPLALQAGDTLEYTVRPFVAQNVSWDMPLALHHLLAAPPLVHVGDQPVLGGVQRPRPNAPTYLFDVQEPSLW